jgi:hypothetical protein
MTHLDYVQRIRIWLTVFIVGLVLSGLTAFALQTELNWLVSVLRGILAPAGQTSELFVWIDHVRVALTETNARYPFLAYGTDWLAFAHLVIAVVFFGPYIDPVRNKWVILFGLIACAGVIPLALIAGHLRGLPLWWRWIDCSFGIVGCIPLYFCWRYIKFIEDLTQTS